MINFDLYFFSSFFHRIIYKNNYSTSKRHILSIVWHNSPSTTYNSRSRINVTANKKKKKSERRIFLFRQKNFILRDKKNFSIYFYVAATRKLDNYRNEDKQLTTDNCSDEKRCWRRRKKKKNRKRNKKN